MPLALVTGAGVRVGRAIAMALAEAGFDLVLHAHRSQEALVEVRKAVEALGRRADTLLADLSSPGAPEQIAKDFLAHGPLDALVHNAGAYEPVPFRELDRARWHRMLAVNLEAPIFLTRALLPLLERAAAPCVVHVTDAALDRPYPGYLHYLVSKAGLELATRALALELGPHVRVNAVAPGTVAFPEDFDESKRERIVKRIPLRRSGTPEDVARAVLYLVRDAPFVTGQTLAVDGGAALT